jgi:D-glycero-alpha-D-manno-heptose-7-phosphate kinase
VIRVSVPTRICDLGGWTDTWFAAHGAVCHLAVWPGVEASLAPGTGPPGVDVHVGAFARLWHWQPGTAPFDYPDPLLAATLDEASPPGEHPLTLRVESDVPPGASMGTSAATCVAVLTVVDQLHGLVRPIADQVARAHRVETVRLGWQSGVQDQWSAAPGAAHLVELDAYPHATCRTVRLPAGFAELLDATLLVIWLGRGHSSSAVHDQVTAALQDAGPLDSRLVALRTQARAGAGALERGDLTSYGHCLTRNTELQRLLHPGLISPEAQRVIDMASRAGALGWKVNGAGGDGGTVTVLCADVAQRDRLAATLPTIVADARILPVTLARDDR